MIPRVATGSGSRALPWLVVAVALVLGCTAGGPEATPTIVPGSSVAPREVNLIARDYSYLPNVLDLVPGETILLHVINGGLVVHEAVIGDASVQDAWETAEAATIGAPPGPTPLVTVPAGLGGVRVVVQSGERVDVSWTVPTDVGAPPGSEVPNGPEGSTGSAGTTGPDGPDGSAGTTGSANSAGTAPAATAWLVGCHIPGHWAKGMVIPIRWVHPQAAGTLQRAAR